MQEQKKNNKTANNRKRQILTGTLLLVIVAVLILLYLNRHARREGPSADLLHHPIYSTYTFEKSDSIIHFGYQPLWLFQSNILEIMKRDAVLKERLGKLGMKIEFHAFLKGEDLNYYVLRNDLQGGTCGDMPTLTIASTLKVVVPMLVDQGYDHIIASRFMSLDNLRGKHIGYPPGSDAHYALLTALESAELSEKDVTLVPMDLNLMSQAMKTRRIDACATWEPITSTILAENPQSVVIHRSLYLGFIYFQKVFADAHTEAILEILASAVRAVRWILINPTHTYRSCEWALADAESLTAELSGVTASDLVNKFERMYEGKFTSVIPSAAIDSHGHLHREFEFLKALNKIPGSSNWQKVREMFTNDYIKEVLDHAEKYQLNELKFIGTSNG